jgi:hypothetical protein
MDSKTLILVIGCGRSGTSAVTGCLYKMGVAVHEKIMISHDNPKGFFENRDVVAMHNRLLEENGGSWDRPPTIMRGRVRASETIADLIRELPGPVCAVKDPRASLCVDLWRLACEEQGVKLCVLEVRRGRDAIVASLMKREGWENVRAENVAKEYALAIHRAREPDIPWATIDFPADLYDSQAWRKILGGFGLALEPDMDAVRAHVDRRLIHYGENGAELHHPPLWTVVIPSRSDEKVIDCVAGLIETHPDIRPEQIVIVSDGLSLRTRWKLRGVGWVRGERPFVFPRAINAGARSAHPDSDLVILLSPPRSLASAASQHSGRARPRQRPTGSHSFAPTYRGGCGMR